MDKVDSDTLIPLSGKKIMEDDPSRPSIQKEKVLAIVGNDVESLFPSLMDVGCARMARLAMEETEICLEDFDMAMALR